MNRVRAFRFPGEQANHETQARETEVSLGLMAEAAGKSDDDSMLHVLGSEAAHRARLARLNALDRELGGLTPTQQGERQSIIKALGELQERREALSGDTPQPRRFGLLSTAAAANPLWGVLTSTPALIAIAFAVPATWGAVTSWRLNHAKHELTEARDVARDNYEAAQEWRQRYTESERAVIDAQTSAARTAESIAARDAEVRRLRARQRRIDRASQDVLNGRGPPNWTSGLRDDEPAAESGAAPAGGANGDHPS